MIFTGLAYAMGGSGGAAGAPSGGGGLLSLAPLLLMFVIFYFLLIRPQQKQQKKLADFLKSLKVGDKVVTTGGIFGEITGLTDAAVTLEIADKVRIKVARVAISGSAQEAAATPDKKG